MSIDSTNKEILNLQQDAPAATLPIFSTEKVLIEHATIEEKELKSTQDSTKPFFLYPRDGLYGLL